MPVGFPSPADDYCQKRIDLNLPDLQQTLSPLHSFLSDESRHNMQPPPAFQTQDEPNSKFDKNPECPECGHFSVLSNFVFCWFLRLLGGADAFVRPRFRLG